ncbi:hypothetical protein HOY82DRAFT_100218 [Tuber indicum]|nr:hypothetical protein HOY82DRAFT_100218 [Tuber indicum]
MQRTAFMQMRTMSVISCIAISAVFFFLSVKAIYCWVCFCIPLSFKMKRKKKKPFLSLFLLFLLSSPLSFLFIPPDYYLSPFFYVTSLPHPVYL